VIKADVDATRLIQKLDGISLGLRDLTPVWDKIHEVFIAFVKRVFASEGGYVGEAWAPLSPGYARWKARHTADKGILQLRGRLYGSLIESQHPDHVFRDGPSFMEVGTRVPYAKFHQTGTRRMPRRPPIKPFSKTEGEAAADIVLAYMLEMTRRGSR